MGMSTHVIGFRPPDETWHKMKAAWDACAAVGLEPPESVVRFFNYESPDAAGVEVEIESREYCGEMQEGIEVDIDALPEGVRVIRFINSW